MHRSTARTAGVANWKVSPCSILTIQHLCEMFDCEGGLFDHTMVIGVSVASVA